jgi:hypothetical protein
MKKGAIVVAEVKGKKFPTEVLKVFREQGTVAVACYFDTSFVEVLSADVKKILGIEAEYAVCLADIEKIEEIVSAEDAELIHPNGFVIIDLPGFYIQFQNSEDIEMWEEFVIDHFPKLEVQVQCSKRVLYRKIGFKNNLLNLIKDLQ